MFFSLRETYFLSLAILHHLRVVVIADTFDFPDRGRLCLTSHLQGGASPTPTIKELEPGCKVGV